MFGLFHPITKLYVVLAALIGLYFGALLIYTENLLVPIMAHATYDAVQLIMTARSSRKKLATREERREEFFNDHLSLKK